MYEEDVELIYSVIFVINSCFLKKIYKRYSVDWFEFPLLSSNCICVCVEVALWQHSIAWHVGSPSQHDNKHNERFC